MVLLICQMATTNELIDLKIENLSEWQSLRGKNVAVDVGIYAPAKTLLFILLRKVVNHV